MPPETQIEEPKKRSWRKTILEGLGVLLCIFIVTGIVFALDVFREVDKYKIVIDPVLGKAKIQLGESTSTSTTNKDQNKKVESKSGIKGMVTIGPVCPVMRDPPDPSCADKPYSAVIDISIGPPAGGGKIIKTFSSKPDGSFVIDLGAGKYTLSQSYKSVMPTFYPVEVLVEKDKYTEVNLQFDSGIR